MSSTPGPWRIEEGTTLIWGNCDPDDLSSYGMGYPIMDGQQPRSWRRDHPTNDEIEGNCRLVAAAPDLLLAIKAMVLDAEAGRDAFGLEAARVAIAKAEGSTNAPAHD